MTVPRPASEHAREALEARVKAYVWNEDLRRDILAAHARLEERIAELAAMLGVPDGGRYLNDWKARASALAVVEQERATLAAFAAEMSGLISDMGDVPDPGLDDLAGMVEAIRGKFERMEKERDELREALKEAVEWLESRPDYTEGDIAVASTGRAALAVSSSEPAEEQG